MVSEAKNILKNGDKFTIQGFCIGIKGQLLINGINVKTRRKCKPIKEAVFTAVCEIKGK